MKQRTRLMHSSDELTGFNMGNKKMEDEDNHEIQLCRIKPQEHFIEAQVQEEDTLQAIALRFHCPISELKRINNIHKDNEIYARRTVRVPITPFSVLTEMLPPSTDNSNTSTSNHVPIVPTQYHDISNVNTQSKEVDFAMDCNEVVMNSTLAPSVRQYSDMEVNESISEDTQLLCNKEKVSVETIVVKQLTSQGADFGIKWYHLMICMVILGVVPLVYVLFYLDKHQPSPDLPPLHNTR